MVVLDASAALSWLMPDEHSDYSDAILTHVGTHGARVPSIWVLEIVNVLIVAERRRRIEPAQSNSFFERLQKLQQMRRLVVVELRLTDGFFAIAQLARKHKLSSYDAAYLHLAKLEGLPIASLDRSLMKAASDADIDLWKPS